MKSIKGFRRTHYGNVNKRVRSLERAGYLETASILNTKAGFEAVAYALTFRTCLALILDALTIDDILDRMSDDVAAEIFASLRMLV